MRPFGRSIQWSDSLLHQHFSFFAQSARRHIRLVRTRRATSDIAARLQGATAHVGCISNVRVSPRGRSTQRAALSFMPGANPKHLVTQRHLHWLLLTSASASVRDPHVALTSEPFIRLDRTGWLDALLTAISVTLTFGLRSDLGSRTIAIISIAAWECRSYPIGHRLGRKVCRCGSCLFPTSASLGAERRRSG
jgi:hypothetical protein